MHFLKDNKTLIISVLFLIPVFYFDETVMTWVRNSMETSAQLRMLHHSWTKFAYLGGNGALLIPLSIVLFLAGRSFNRRLMTAGKSLFFGLIISGLSTQIIKHLIGRARPRVTDRLRVIGPSFKGSFDSFPSGHSALVFCLAFTLSHYYPKYRYFFYAFAVITGLGRVGSASHFLSDVAGGAILGIIVAKIVLIKLANKEVTTGTVKAG